MPSKIVLCSMFLIVLEAQQHQTEYPSECLADWDPFCPLRPGGTGYTYYIGCFTCFWIPEGPEGQPSYYVCLNEGGVGKPSRCTNYSWGCVMGGLCVLA